MIHVLDKTQNLANEMQKELLCTRAAIALLIVFAVAVVVFLNVSLCLQMVYY